VKFKCDLSKALLKHINGDSSGFNTSEDTFEFSSRYDNSSYSKPQRRDSVSSELSDSVGTLSPRFSFQDTDSVDNLTVNAAEGQTIDVNELKKFIPPKTRKPFAKK
jgi:hypothetical protein